MAIEKQSGGVGLHYLVKWNKAFGGKLVWRMYTNSESKWCQIMQAKYLDSCNPLRIFSISNPPDGSTMWNFMISSRDLVTKYISWQVHNGELVNFWFDSWNGYPPLAQNNQLQQVIPIFIMKWGHKLVNYVSGLSAQGKSSRRTSMRLKLKKSQKSYFN